MSNTMSVTGTDGIVPVYDPEGRWCWWSLNEIYVPNGPGTKRYVPKVDDYVIDPVTFTTYIVKAIDSITLESTLQQIRPANMSYTLTETDVLFGVGPGTQSDTYRMYVDSSVVPTVIDVDARLKVGGTMCEYAQIFLGSDTSDAGKIISRIYDASGNFISHNVPLELVAIDSHVNYSIKKVSTCYTNQTLVDGEVVTVVLYSADGHVVSKRQLLVENTAFIRQVNAGKKYVTSISLECPFLSATQGTIIEYPLNVPINAINLVGVVNYSDGSSMKLPVNGVKFSMLGLEQYVSTIIGQKMDLVLSYKLDSDEAVYGAVTSDNKYVTAAYTLRTVNPNNSYAVKVFGYPVWVDQANGYVMNWFLFNLDRNVWFNVTPYVEFAENTGAFNPLGYGYMQRKAIQLNLQDVSGAFKPFVHTELVEIILNGRPSADSTPWTVRNGSSSSDEKFGTGLYANRDEANYRNLDVSSGFTTQADWLAALYYKTYPLIDRVGETDPPVPTHFILSYGNDSIECAVSNWNQIAVFSSNIPLGATVFIRFIKRTPTTELELSMAAMMVLQ